MYSFLSIVAISLLLVDLDAAQARGRIHYLEHIFSQTADLKVPKGEWFGKKSYADTCFEIYWKHPDFKNVLGVTLSISSDLRKFNASAIRRTATEMFEGDMRYEHRGNSFVFYVQGGTLESYGTKRISFKHNGWGSSAVMIVLAQVCVEGRRRKHKRSLDEFRAKLKLTYTAMRHNRTEEVIDDSKLYFEQMSRERFDLDLGQSEKRVEGVEVIQLEDQGYEAFGVTITNTHWYYYTMCLWWFANGKAVAPISLRRFEDPNIRLVIPAVDLSQFAYDNGYSASWTGVEWGFNERNRQWCLVNPYGTVVEVLGAQNEFDMEMVGGMTPVMVYSRMREDVRYADLLTGEQAVGKVNKYA